MICKVKKTIERFGMLKGAKSVAVGLSGGADSVCLFDILLKLRNDYGYRLVCVHVNHNLRGDEAKRDQDFVQSLCKKNGIELKIVSANVAALAKKRHIGIEECGRTVRYEAFESAGCDRIAVAHSLSDCIETSLFNLARGSSLSGICRIAPVRGTIIRPLIDCTSQEIRDYCGENGLSFVIDSTNFHDDYTRNFIRHNIIPEFKKINADFEKSFSRFYETAERDEAYLEWLAQNVLAKAKQDNGFSRSVLLEQDDAVLFRCVRLMLESRMKKQTEKKHIDLAVNIIKSTGTLQLGKDLYISASCDIIWFHSAESCEESWLVSGSFGRFGSPYKTYELTVVPFDKSCLTGDNNICDASFLSTNVIMRSRKAGDKMTLFPRNVTKTLKKLFNEAKIPQNERGRLAVLESDGKLIWCEKFGVNAPYRVSRNTKMIAIIKTKER